MLPPGHPRLRPAAATATLTLLLALSLLPSLAASPATEGPYVGVLLTGQSATHHYDNHPYPDPCPDYFAPVPWTVRLEYEPPTADVTLHVSGHGSATGANGVATLSWEGDGCEILELTVAAGPVAPAGVPGLVTYVLGVHPHSGPGASDS